MCLFKEGDVLDGCEIDRCALDGIGSDTQPRTEYGCMSGSVVMGMLGSMGGQLRIDNPAEHHKPEGEPSECHSSNRSVHKPYSKSCALFQLLFLNSRNGTIDLLFQSTARL